MFKIYIDTTDRYKKFVKLFDGEKEVAEKSGDIDVVSAIQQLLTENNLTPDQVEYDVNKGPGSFTGIKMGVTVANVLNWATGKKQIDELIQPEYGREPNITLRTK
ncbi:MAG TPA: hypothetical protein VLI92_04750 [Candidatus Saccharimonadales bacterium]|nr:hypothetical protein [Candidatus Saccharimonadales bacterium]